MPVTIPLQSSIELGAPLDKVPAKALESAWGELGGGAIEALEKQPAQTVKVHVCIFLGDSVSSCVTASSW